MQAISARAKNPLILDRLIVDYNRRLARPACDPARLGALPRGDLITSAASCLNPSSHSGSGVILQMTPLPTFLLGLL